MNEGMSTVRVGRSSWNFSQIPAVSSMTRPRSPVPGSRVPLNQTQPPVYDAPGRGRTLGAAAYQQHVVTPLLNAFPDLQFRPGETVTQADRVAMQFTMSGTHQGRFEGIPPTTGKQFAVPGVVLARVAKGKIEELRGVFDGVGMMQQLGVLPAQS